MRLAAGLEAFGRDLRHSARALVRSPGFTIAATLTLGLGIGGNAAMLRAIDRLMFRPMPYLRDPATVHRVYFQLSPGGHTTTRSRGSYTAYVDLQNNTTSFAHFAAFTEEPLALGEGESTREGVVAGVSASFFDFFDVRPKLGRFLDTREDVVPRGADVAILGYAYWQSEFGGRDVIGRRLDVGPLTTTIVGVAPEGFVGVSEGEAPAVFLPITTLAYGLHQGDAESFARKYSWYWMNVMVRRKPGVSVTAADADLTRAFTLSREKQRAELPSTLPPAVAHPRAVAGALRTLAGPDAGLESRTLLWVTGVAAIVLLITCANLANLLLARLLRRQRELAVRRAIGMSNSQLVTQLAAEGLVLAALGAVGGAVTAQIVTAALARFSIGGFEQNGAIDWRLFVLAGVLALGAAMIISLLPAVVALRGNFVGLLRAGTRAGTYQHGRLQAALLTVQAMLAVVLLVGAGLFVQSLSNAQSLRLGWDPEPVLVVTPNYRGVQLDSVARAAYPRRLLAAAQQLSGVVAAARVDNLPFLTNTQTLRVDGIDSVAKLGRFVSNIVSPDYFKVMGTRIVRGRGLNVGDRAGAPPVVVVSEAMGRVLWPGRDPIGQCIYVVVDAAPCTRIVGIAEDVVSTSLADEDRFAYYLSDEQPPSHLANRIFVRLSGDDPLAYGERVRRAMQREMPGNAYVTVTPLEDLVDAQRRSWTLGARMFVAFGALALVVAALGLYAVISYQAVQRRHEFGVRVALGAQTRSIVRLVVGQAVSFASGGAVLGMLLAFGAGHWLQPLLFHESAHDPGVFGLVTVTMIAVAVLASAVPSLRASRADPMVALKSD